MAAFNGYTTDTEEDEDCITREEMLLLLRKRIHMYHRVGVQKVYIKDEVISSQPIGRIVQSRNQVMFISPSYYQRNIHLRPLLYTSQKTRKNIMQLHLLGGVIYVL